MKVLSQRKSQLMNLSDISKFSRNWLDLLPVSRAMVSTCLAGPGEPPWSLRTKMFFLSLLFRQRWHTARRCVEVADMCLLKNSNVYRDNWMLC